MRRASIVFIVVCLLAPVATAQSLPPVVGSARAMTWGAAVGPASVWVRDISRHGVPMDASPVAWRGDGTGLLVTFDADRPKRLHRVEGSFLRAAHFALDSPLRAVATSPEDRAWYLGGRYEYRRYPFRDVALPGLRIGIGVESLVETRRYERHVRPDITIGTAATELGGGGVMAVAYDRGSRLGLQAAWTNGVTIGRSSMDHSEAERLDPAWGGGWLSELFVRGDVRVVGRTSISVSYFGAGQGRLASHDGYGHGRRRVTVGVTYAP